MSGIHADGDTDSEVRKVRCQQDDSKLASELRSANVDSDSENDQHKQHRGEGRPEERLVDGQSGRRDGGGGSGDKQSIQNVGSDDIPDGEIAVTFSGGLNRGYQFRQ